MLIMFANNIPMIMETDSDKYKWDVAFTKNVICSHQLKKATDNIEKMFALQSDHAKTFALTLSK